MIMRQTGHKRTDTLVNCIRSATLFKNSPAADFDCHDSASAGDGVEG